MTQEAFATVVEQYVCPALAGAAVSRVLHESAGTGQITLQDEGRLLEAIISEIVVN